MKLTEFLGQEVIRPLVTLVILGSIALYPWVIQFDSTLDPFKGQVGAPEGLAMFGLALAAGVARGIAPRPCPPR